MRTFLLTLMLIVSAVLLAMAAIELRSVLRDRTIDRCVARTQSEYVRHIEDGADEPGEDIIALTGERIKRCLRDDWVQQLR